MKITDILAEGPNDPQIFKAVFLAGGPGSGKSYVANKLLSGFGLRTINSDDIYEYLAKKHEIDLGNPDIVGSEQGQEIRNRAKQLTKSRRGIYLDGRLGVILDGTGKDVEKVAKDKKALEELGYECVMIMVNTDLEITKQRNQMRDRTVPEDMLVKMWQQVQSNIGKFQRIFGSSNFYIVDNTHGLDHPDVKDDVHMVAKELRHFLTRSPNSHIAKQWIASQKPNAEPVGEGFGNRMSGGTSHGNWSAQVNAASKKAYADAAEKRKKMGLVTSKTLADINKKLGNTKQKTHEAEQIGDENMMYPELRRRTRIWVSTTFGKTFKGKIKARSGDTIYVKIFDNYQRLTKLYKIDLNNLEKSNVKDIKLRILGQGEQDVTEGTGLLGPQGAIHKAASAEQSDREYIQQMMLKDKWKKENPGKKWPGYEKARLDLETNVKEAAQPAREVTQADLQKLEMYADKVFAKVGIDVEFTRHFLDRVNDERNIRQITLPELAVMFRDEYAKWGKKIAQLGPDAQAVMKDMRSDINIPFALNWDPRNRELDLVAKTVMRKKNFKTPNKEFPVESITNEENEYTVRYHGSPHKFNGFNTNDVFLAKDKKEAMRYGPYVYEVTYAGKPKFQTNTIEVISPEQVISLKIAEHNPDQKIYRT